MVIEPRRYSLPEINFSVFQSYGQWRCGVKLADDLPAVTDEQLEAIREWRMLNLEKYRARQTSRV